MTTITDYDRKFLADLGVRLKARRVQLHLSGAELARRVDVSRVTIWRIERGSGHSICLLTVMRIMAALTMDPGATLPTFQPDGWSRSTLNEFLASRIGTSIAKTREPL